MTDPRTQLADTITALVDPYQHAETYTPRADSPKPQPASTLPPDTGAKGQPQ